MGNSVDPDLSTSTGSAVDRGSIQSDIEDINDGIAVVEQAITRQYAAAQPDKFGRVPAEMPDAIRTLYEAGTWHRHEVYMWDLVLSVAAEGHAKAQAAHDNLAGLSFRSFADGGASVAYTTLPAEHSTAVAEAVASANALGEHVQRVVEDRRAKRKEHLKQLYSKYRNLQRAHLSLLQAAEEQRSPEVKEARLERDRLLVMATRASSGMGGGMSTKEIDTSLEEIQKAGGTAGGLSRWGSSLATIPNQDPSYHPLEGGILMDDPLAAHYTAKNVNPWTRAERLLFLEKFLSHNKNFRRIATFFEHKSVDDVVRFYFDNKKPLKLKQLTKDAQLKKRTTKKNALVELSRLPTESRSIANNFAGDAEWFGPHYSANENLFSASMTNATHCRDIRADWSSRERQALIFALCRRKIVDDLNESQAVIPIVWCRISREVGSRTPAQCRSFYIQNKSVLGLDRYQPLESDSKISTPKRPRGPDDLASKKGIERDANRRRISSSNNAANFQKSNFNSTSRLDEKSVHGMTKAGFVAPKSHDASVSVENQTTNVITGTASELPSRNFHTIIKGSSIEVSRAEPLQSRQKATADARPSIVSAHAQTTETVLSKDNHTLFFPSTLSTPSRDKLPGSTATSNSIGMQDDRATPMAARIVAPVQTTVGSTDSTPTGPNSGEVLVITAVSAPGPEPVN
jgi:hypothetical protein